MVIRPYCGDRFAMYINAESICCTPKSNIILYVNYTSIKEKERNGPLKSLLVEIKIDTKLSDRQYR